MRRIIFSAIFWGFVGILLIASDICAKWLAYVYLKNPISLLSDFLQLEYFENTGVAFSIPMPNFLMIILTPLLLVVVIWIVTKTFNMESAYIKSSLMLIIAGGLGNFLNRIWTGSVIDMIKLSFWPAFNLADSFLTIGVAMLLVVLIFAPGAKK